MKRAIAIGLVVVSSSLASYRLGARAALPERARSAAAEPETEPPVVESGSAASVRVALGTLAVKEALRDVLREEMPALLANVPRASGALPPAAAPEEPPTSQQEEAIGAAQALLANATQAGRWTVEDREAWRRVRALVPQEQQKALLGALVTKLNSGQIVTDSIASPF